MLDTTHEQWTRQVFICPSELSQDIDAFLTDRQARGLADGTLYYYRFKLRYLQEYLESQGVGSVEDVTPNHLREYLLHLGQRFNPGGVRCCFRAMRTFFRWYEAEYEPEGWKNPIRKVGSPRCPDEPLAPVPLDDLKAMLATCRRKTPYGDRDRAMLLGMLDTGCRASEFLALDIGDVDLATGAAIVRHGKGDKRRTVFFGAKARRELLRYLRHRRELTPDSPLWTTRTGDRLTYTGLRQMVQRRANKARVNPPSLHGFRRAFALLSLRNGADIYSLQRLMGHADLTVLRRYLAQTDADLLEAHRRSGPVDNGL